jgi:hypothetical protein
VFRGRINALLILAFAATGCVESGNYGWDLGRWEPPLVAEPEVEAFRGVHEGRIGLRCVRGGEPSLFIETWRPLLADSPAREATLTYRIEGVGHSTRGRLGPKRFDFDAASTPALLEQLTNASHLEALIPVDGGRVYPVTFNVSDFAQAHAWVRGECRELGSTSSCRHGSKSRWRWPAQQPSPAGYWSMRSSVKRGSPPGAQPW